MSFRKPDPFTLLLVVGFGDSVPPVDEFEQLEAFKAECAKLWNRRATVSADERPACDCKTWEPCKAPLHRDCKRLTSTVDAGHE